jgi:ankyrin repeat protein
MDSSSPDLVKAFVMASHGDLDTVRTMLTAHPELLNVEYDWGAAGGLEAPIGAAAHVGNRAIAEFLLDKGAPSNICVAAMLGKKDEIKAALDQDSTLANARGAHGIPVMFHAAMSGNVEVAEMLLAAGCKEGFNGALHGAISYGHLAMVDWLLSHGVSDINTPNWQGKTPIQNAEEQNNQAIVERLQQFQVTG